MTQTNQNKDYSWQWLDDVLTKHYSQFGGRILLDDIQEAKAAIIAEIDEHYIGKGEAIIRITDAELDEVVNQIGKFLDKGLPGNAAVRLRQFANKVKARSESEVEQRCIEARKDQHEKTSNLFVYENATMTYKRIKKMRAQLSTNNKDTKS